MRIWLATIPALLLVGCGVGDGGDDFSVEVKRPVAAVMVPYLGANIDEAKALFPDITFHRTRPADRELLFTIPGSGDTESTIRLRFEPVKNGEATVVHAAVDVPPVKAQIEGVQKYLSESKVERLLKSQIRSTGQALEAREAPDSDSFSVQLMGLAIATNPLYLQRALDLKDSPESLLGALLAFGDYDPSVDGAGDPDAPMDNPDAAAGADDAKLADAEWREEQQADEASAPMDNTYSE
jgi:hypothetical protein